MGRLRFGFCLLTLFLFVDAMPAQAQAQDHPISGTVTDAETGAPLPGVNVVVKEATVGAATAADGSYELTVPSAQDTLVFSFIGYERVEVPINGRSVVDVALAPDVSALNEVVVVGYGTKTRQQLASSVTTINAEELEGVTTESVATLLQGKAPGVFVASNSGEPGNSPGILVRGQGSISAGSGPLYVVDGVIADASVAQYIPSSNIASITVLKDAAATALYGSRAANGVIVITTKTGEPGDTQINVSSSVGFNEPMFGNFELMNARQLYGYHQAMGMDNLSEDVLSQNTDWIDLAFRRALTSTLNLSASGGNEQTTFYVAGGYYKEEGTLVSTGYDRLSFRANLEHAVNDRFHITARVYGSYETRLNNVSGALYQAYTNLPWDAPYNENGEPVDPREAEWRSRDDSNFLYPLQYNWSDGEYQDYSLDLKLAYDLAPWLSFSTTNRFKFEYDHVEEYYDKRTQAAATNGGELFNEDGYTNTFLTSNLLKADHDFGDHSLSGLLGFEYQHNYSRGMSGWGIGIYPGLEVLNVTSEPLSLSGGKEESAFVAGFAQANYGYKDTYFLTASFRRDGSSRFGTGNRYGNFYSVGAAWMVSNEAFLNDAAAVDRLKLRASYGTTGNAEFDSYGAQSRYTYSVGYDDQPGSVAAWLGDPRLTWEVGRMFNAGIDLGLFNRIDLTVDVYRRVNTNLLMAIPMPGTSGWYSRVTNIGAVRNHGLELALSTENLTGPFSWSTDFSLALNRNEVLELYRGRPILGGHQRIIEGRDMNSWYLRAWAGVDPETGAPLWEKLVYDEEGNVTDVELTSDYSEATLQYMGTSTPDFTGGMRNTLRYKGFTLSVFVNFVYGNQVYHRARELFDSDGAYPTYNNMVLMDGWSRWQEPGDHATHPKPISGGNRNSNKPSSRYLEDGSYLRVRNVTLSYQLPGSLLAPLGLRSVQVYVSGDNLWTLTNFSGMDPEIDLNGFMSTKYPLSRTVLFGVRLGL